MEKHTLKTEKRKLTGRKVKRLRSEGLIPANIYGKKIKSAEVQVKTKEFLEVLKKAGQTALIELKLGDETRPVLIHNVQYDPLTSEPLHTDFYQVDLKEKVTAKVPIEIIGEAPAVTQKLGVILTLLHEVEVEALPADLPEKLVVDISGLAAVDQEFKVADIAVSDKTKVLTDLNQVVIKIGALVSEEAKKMAEEEAAAAAAKAAEATAAAVPEGAVPAAEATATPEPASTGKTDKPTA